MQNYEKNLDEACAKFRKILEDQLTRVENMNAQGDFVDYASLKTIRIGVCGGDGIGPTITAEARRVLEFMLADLVESGTDFWILDIAAVGLVVADIIGVVLVARDQVDMHLGLVHIVNALRMRTDVDFVAGEHEKFVVGQLVMGKRRFMVGYRKDAVAV